MPAGYKVRDLSTLHANGDAVLQTPATLQVSNITCLCFTSQGKHNELPFPERQVQCDGLIKHMQS